MPKSGRRRVYKLTTAVARVTNDIEAILARRQSTRYLEGIVLMYSLLENILRWLVFVKVLWDKSNRVLRSAELDALKRFCNQQEFGSALNTALAIGLIKHSLFRKLDRIRVERNDLVHHLYLFIHRRNSRVLRAKLARLVEVAEELYGLVNALVDETGADDSYDIFNVRRKKELLV
jgi:hypothetical protein